MELVRILVIGALFAIVASLGTALYHLATDKGDSKKMVRALTLRVGLSMGLFLLLMLAWWAGIIAPHGISR
jgi:drug/metabolite transporter (DMT)-like permease